MGTLSLGAHTCSTPSLQMGRLAMRTRAWRLAGHRSNISCACVVELATVDRDAHEEVVCAADAPSAPRQHTLSAPTVCEHAQLNGTVN
eukprot:444097-Pyramimonas_sp.AAC.1